VTAFTFVAEPVGPETTTSTTPTARTGDTAITLVAVFDVMDANVPPNVTLDVLTRFVPVMVTVVPPPVPLLAGVSDVTAGGVAKVNAKVRVAFPPGVVTTIDTAVALAAFAGVVTVTEVAVAAVIVPAVPPNVTDVACAKFVPVNVTD
jgi:hypothetical protein